MTLGASDWSEDIMTAFLGEDRFAAGDFPSARGGGVEGVHEDLVVLWADGLFEALPEFVEAVVIEILAGSVNNQATK